MARKTIEKIYSDISGEEVEGGDTTYFALDGTSYEIDLTDAERKALTDALEPYVSAARKGRSGSRGKRAASSNPSSDAKAIRAWAAENGIDVPARGRIPASVAEAYRSAN